MKMIGYDVEVNENRYDKDPDARQGMIVFGLIILVAIGIPAYHLLPFFERAVDLWVKYVQDIFRGLMMRYPNVDLELPSYLAIVTVSIAWLLILSFAGFVYIMESRRVKRYRR